VDVTPVPGVAKAGLGRVHVVGAGLAGLSAATILASQGVPVTLHEAAGQAGGRCRSYFDPALGTVIDNGNHLVLSGNRAVQAYLSRIGALHNLTGPARADFAFADLDTGARWTLSLNDGALPWWTASKKRRVPGTMARDYLAYGKLLWAGPAKTVGQTVPCQGPLWDRLMQPFLLAALNTEPALASAALAGAVLRQSLLKGGGACRPRIATPTLAAAFVEPALAFLESAGAVQDFGRRLRGLVSGPRIVAALEFPEAVTVPVSARDAVVLAVPPWVAKDIVPGLIVPDDFRAIVNAHFKLQAPVGTPPILGVVGGIAEWIFTFDDRISVTISGADAIVDRDREDLARAIWADVARALKIDTAMPASSLPRWQIVKEKRATFAATPAQDARRPSARTGWKNLFLAGDWTRTGLPATIEGALKSGETAAALALRHLRL